MKNHRAIIPAASGLKYGESGKKEGGKRRRSDDTFQYLKDKNQQEFALRKQELELKQAELEERKAESDAFRQLLLQQQNQNSVLIQQQQKQVNLALLQFLNNNE